MGIGSSNHHGADRPSNVKITEPFHGAVLNHRHGKQIAAGLTIRVSGEARPGDRVTVNGVPCRREGKRFAADVLLHQPETDLVAVAEGTDGRQPDRVRVAWDRYSVPRYRFMIDDNSFFLRDIAQKGYKSLFDCFYLKGLRDLHNKYRTKFCLNIYYVAADDAKFPTDADFRLPQFPDRYKSEWRDNANWLRLAFHAYSNMPDRPYQDAPPEKLMADLDLVAAEIRRFAGDEVYAPPSVIHWAMTRHSAFKPLYQRGVRVLTSGFWHVGDRWDINYNWDDVISAYCSPQRLEGFRERDRVFAEQPLLQPGSGGPDRGQTGSGHEHPRHGRNRRHRHPRTVLLAVLLSLHSRSFPATRHDAPLGDRARLQAGFLSRRLFGRTSAGAV